MLAITTKYYPQTQRILATTCNGHRSWIPCDKDKGALENHAHAARELIATQFTHIKPDVALTYGHTERGFVFCAAYLTV